MTRSRLERLAPLSGIAAVAALVGSTLAIGFYEYLPAPDVIHTHFVDNATSISVGGYLGMFGGVLLLWFSGSVRTMLRSAEGGNGRVSAIAFGGGVATAALMILGYSTVLATAVRAGSDGGITSEGVVTLYDLASTVQGVGMGYAMAVLVGGFAVVAVRTGVVGRWLGWASAVIALGLVTPVSYAVLPLALVWVVVVGLIAYAAGRPAPYETV